MTRPVSRLSWTPDTADPHAVRARWVGSGWHYTIRWGDGTSDRVLHWQGAQKHTYPGPGTYSLVCVSEIRDDVTVSAQVTVRDALAPQVRLELDGATLTAALGSLPNPVDYQIEWGDGNASRHGADDLAPSHTYPWGFGAPTVTVTDVPSQRAARLTGPTIGDDPSTLPMQGFLLRYVSDDPDGNAQFEMLGGGQTPGDQVVFYPRRSWAGAVTLTADDTGRVRHVFTHPKALTPEWEDAWRSYSVQHKGGWEFLPVQPVAMRGGDPQVTYTVSATDPLDVDISVWPPMLGVHYVHFGDGFDVRVDVTELPLRVSHNYAYQRPDRPITVFLPDGRKASRPFGPVDPCPPCYNPNYSGSCSIGWNWVGDQHCPGRCGGDTEPFAPLRVDTGGAYPPHVLHKPDNGTGYACAYGYTGMQPGSYAFTYTSFDTGIRKHGITIAKAAWRRVSPDVEVVALDDGPAGPAVLTCRFGEVTTWDGGYSGEFTVTNQEPDAPTPWEIEFQLADPAVLREVWPATASFADLGGSRWRIRSAVPVGERPAVVGARIEPPGRTRAYPDQIQARPYTPTTGGADDG